MTPEDLAQYGSLGVAAYAVLQLSRFVATISTFLTKLEQSWVAQEKHRAEEKAHWEILEKRLGT